MMQSSPISLRTAVEPSSNRAEAATQQLRRKYSLGFMVRLERKSPSLPEVCLTEARTSISSSSDGIQNSLTSVMQNFSLGKCSNTPPKIKCHKGRQVHHANSVR